MIKTLASTFNALRSASANIALDLAIGKDIAEKIRIIQNAGIFDHEFYGEQIQQPKISYSTAVAHYLNEGAKNHLDPHPLFSTSFYGQNNADVDFNTYNPLLHFIIEGGKKGRDPHPLFESQFYINTYLDVRQSAINPLVHYLHFGAKERRSPAFTFNARRYTKKAQEADLRAYFKDRAGKKINFAREIKQDVFLRTSAQFKLVQKIIKRRENLLMYFLSTGIERNVLPFPSFELLYEIQPPSNGQSSTKEGKRYFKIVPRNFSKPQRMPKQFEQFAMQVAKANINKEKYPIFKDLVQCLKLRKNSKSFLQSENTIVLFSHVASLTGAPLLLLQIARGLVDQGFECLLFLEREGELEDEFSEVAHTINFQEAMGREQKCDQYVSLLFDDLHFKKPKVAIANSLETGAYTKVMNKSGIKVMSLVHELVDTYPLSFLMNAFENSKLAVFPAKFVRDFAINRLRNNLNSCPQIILPNALLNPDFGNYDRDKARSSLRQEAGIKNDSLIVLGCGAPEMRKGFDLFVQVARLVIASQNRSSEKFSGPVHFVWVGADSIERFSPHYYITWDIKQGQLGTYLHLLRSRKDLRAIFNGSDVFILPSRKDPFPCVVQDAMAAQLPIVAFDNAGGVPEMVEGGGAKIVPYGDLIGFSAAVEEYLSDAKLRQADGKTNAALVREKFNFDKYLRELKKQIALLASG